MPAIPNQTNKTEKKRNGTAARLKRPRRREFDFGGPQSKQKIAALFRNMHKTVNDERGSQLFEYIAVLPMLFIVMLIGWQMFMVGHTFIVTANAAREGARALAVCGGGDVQGVANRTSPGYSPVVLQASRGSRNTTVRIGNEIPKIRIVGFLDPALPRVEMRATMRTEECR